MIKVSVFTSFQFPDKINLNVGGTIDFLNKNQNKKSYLMNDAEWKIEDPSIVKLDPITNVFKAISEGKTRVHLLSKDNTKAKLSTLINVGRVKKINVITAPALITNIKTHPSYSSEYRIAFKYYLDDDDLSSDSNDENNTIDQKLNVKCVSNNPNLFTATAETRKINGRVVPDEKECVIKLREVKYDYV